MYLLKNKCNYPGTLLIRAMFLTVLLTVLGCSDSAPPESALTEKMTQSFTFFDLGVNTLLSKEILQTLDDRLGSHSLEKRGLIDLSIQPTGALEKYFSDLYSLNRELNSPAGERVEHDIRRVMYRYAARRGSPFHYIETVFSGESGRPLYFKIEPVSGETDFMDTFHEKYGAPVVTKWPRAGVKFLSWTKAGDRMIVSMGTDRYGAPEYHITIFYTRNLDRVLALKRSGSKETQEKAVNAGKTAF